MPPVENTTSTELTQFGTLDPEQKEKYFERYASLLKLRASEKPKSGRWGTIFEGDCQNE